MEKPTKHNRRASASRREFLWSIGGGLGGIALAQLLGRNALLADGAFKPRPEFNGGLHHHAQGKRVIQLFLKRGVRPMVTIDYKPQPAQRNGPEIRSVAPFQAAATARAPHSPRRCVHAPSVVPRPPPGVSDGRKRARCAGAA